MIVALVLLHISCSVPLSPYVTTKVGGTGLGLAVVKKIADEHGARIDLTNRMDNGMVQGAGVAIICSCKHRGTVRGGEPKTCST